MNRLDDVRSILSSLVAFDTTSRRSNLDLIAWTEAFLDPWATSVIRLPSRDGLKANLWARFGPDEPGGWVLSGHTDVVPVDGQPWETDPWTLTERSGRLYGRGASDMKGFLALCLAHARQFSGRPLKRPVHFAFSYDEEVGCAGVGPMIEQIMLRGAAPSVVWVGEPTLWNVVSAHKGVRVYDVVVTGKDAHASNPALGASAIHEALELLVTLRGIARRAEMSPVADPTFEPAYPTLTIGAISGGTAANILARECRFTFDLRLTPDVDPDELLTPFFDQVHRSRERLSVHGPECGVSVQMNADAPGLGRRSDSEAERLLRLLTGDNAVRSVAYATEAGLFQQAGLSSVICGPGSIDQAHQPNEFLAVSELERGFQIFDRFLGIVS